MDEPVLFNCMNWSINNQCCIARYNNSISPLFDNFKSNENNFDKNCKGKSNYSLCVAFRGIEISERDRCLKTLVYSNTLKKM
jgi:hypothetical protein